MKPDLSLTVAAYVLFVPDPLAVRMGCESLPHEPVFERQARDAAEMLDIARDKNRTGVKGGRRDEQVCIGQEFAGLLKFRLDLAELAEQGAGWLQLIENIRKSIHALVLGAGVSGDILQYREKETPRR